MARFMAKMYSQRGKEIHRLYHSNGEIQLNGWNEGITVKCFINEYGEDMFEVYSNGGSNNKHAERFIILLDNNGITSSA